ncbi:MAG: hypothetical protein HY843_03245 [Bdellovibrio sp.]|nr:hypothetical protein [Bdellovibrio sp.]
MNSNYLKLIFRLSGVSMSVFVFTFLIMSPYVRGELVYDNASAIAQVSAQTAVHKNNLNQLDQNVADHTLEDSENQGAIQGGQTVAPIIIQQRPTAITTSEASSTAAQSTNISKTELLRRERMREEVKNEDVLQERLETLRLKDEQKRTDQILSNNLINQNSGLQNMQNASQQNSGNMNLNQSGTGNLQIQTESLITPTTAENTNGTQTNVAIASATNSAATLQESGLHKEGSSHGAGVSLAPRIGMANMSDSQTFKIDSRYSAGIGLGVDVSSHAVIELGYAFNEYGVSYTSGDFFVANSIAYASGGGYQKNFDPVAMKQNVFEGGVKLNMLGNDSKIKPFIGGGGAYSKSYINYDQKVIQIMRQSYGLNHLTDDYEVSSFLGYMSTGLDIKLGDSIALGAAFKYYKVLSAKENGVINVNGMYGNAYYPYGYYSTGEYEKSMVGGSLARSSFYTITAGVSFNF